MNGNAFLQKKEKRKRRAKGEFIIGKRKDWREKESKIGQIKEERVAISRIKKGWNKRDVVIVSIYNSENWKTIKNTIMEIFEKNKKENVIIGGDFNIRIGEEGRWDEQTRDNNRKSKDKIIGSRERKMID